MLKSKHREHTFNINARLGFRTPDSALAQYHGQRPGGKKTPAASSLLTETLRLGCVLTNAERLNKIITSETLCIHAENKDTHVFICVQLFKNFQ